MKKKYLQPTIEVFSYLPEKGYATTVASRDYIDRDYVLIEGSDRQSLRNADEVSEYTDNNGEFTTGEWL